MNKKFTSSIAAAALAATMAAPVVAFADYGAEIPEADNWHEDPYTAGLEAASEEVGERIAHEKAVEAEAGDVDGVVAPQDHEAQWAAASEDQDKKLKAAKELEGGPQLGDVDRLTNSPEEQKQAEASAEDKADDAKAEDKTEAPAEDKADEAKAEDKAEAKADKPAKAEKAAKKGALPKTGDPLTIGIAAAVTALTGAGAGIFARKNR